MNQEIEEALKEVYAPFFGNPSKWHTIAAILAKAYSEQEIRIKDLQNNNEDYRAVRGSMVSRIAALELALNKIIKADQVGYFGKIAGESISNHKLGDLFQALLEEHNLLRNPNMEDRAPHEFQYEKVELLRKECGL